MYRMLIVLELLVLYVGISHSWDIAIAHQNHLKFYTKETKTDSVRFNGSLRALAYDEVHDKLLFATSNSSEIICGYVISSNTNQCLGLRDGRKIHGLAFDPVTELLFFSDTNEKSISSISVSPVLSGDVNLVIKLDEGIPTDIAVDSCRGYVYWININLSTPKIERSRFDGSEREVILNLSSWSIGWFNKLEPHSLVIDQGTQTMYWVEPKNSTTFGIYYADLNGDNKILTTNILFYNKKFANPSSNAMTVSETALYLDFWCSDCERKVYKLGKKEYIGETTIFKMDVTNEVFSIVAKHQMRIQDLKNCEALKCLEEKNSVEPYCVHGEKVFGRCLCKCAPGYIGKRCDISACDNYCLQGSCSVNDEGQPKCRCNSGYSGERCGNSEEFYCVHGEKVIGQSVCKCLPGYIGERCDVSVCDNYCLQGNCSVNNDGLPKCRCNSGYSGERCGNFEEFYCVHGGKVNGQSVCKCLPGYIGERCDVSVCDNYCLQGNCSVNNDGLPKCRCNSGYSGERCGNYDGFYCVHGEKVIGQSVCKCLPGYIGERCDVSVCDNYCLQGNCSVNNDGLPKCRCNSGYSGERCGNFEEFYCVHGGKVNGQSVCKCLPGYIGERCDVSVCDNYCLQGNCSVNNDGLPKCRCNSGYSGERCGNYDGFYCVHGEKVIGQSVCKCLPGYIGERCDVSVCDNYCLQGNCSVNNDGLPKCRCNSGYSGERCGNSEEFYCVHGEKVIGQSVCKCLPGYIGERCDVSVCVNYCFHGNCSVNDKGLPKCRCHAGYSGKRCGNSDGLYCVYGEKVIGQSVCKCLRGYVGERCDMSVCDNYCLQGNCSVNNDGLPKCRCNAGYSGERCENSDGLYCVHGQKVIGQSICKCARGYIGERCELSVCNNYCLKGFCTVNDEGLPNCSCDLGYSGERCENTDGFYCLHGELLEVIGQSVCKCLPGYIGERCDVSVCGNYCLQGNCTVNDEGFPKCRCATGYSGERCEVVACHGFCLNNGACVLNEEEEPSCDCAEGYEGSRCEFSLNSGTQ